MQRTIPMNTVQINNVHPDDGSVLISLTPTILSGFGYINSLSIQAVPSDVNMPSGRKVAQTGDKSMVSLNADLVPEPNTGGNVIVGTYPNPFVDDITLKLSLENPVNRAVVMLKDVSGRPVFSTVLTNLPKGLSEHKLGLKGGKLPPGLYGLQLLGLPGEQKVAVVVVK